MWHNMGSQGIFQFIYNNRCHEYDAMKSVLESMELKFGEDFYRRLMKKGVIHHFITSAPERPSEA